MLAVIVPIGIGGLVFFALWFWAVLDCIATDSILVRNLPKQTWIFIVIFLPTAGALAWLLLGRPEGAGLSIGGTYRPPDYTTRDRAAREPRTPRPKSRGFEDSAAWEQHKRALPKADPATNPRGDDADTPAVRERRLAEWEAELRKREAALDAHSETDETDPSDD